MSALRLLRRLPLRRLGTPRSETGREAVASDIPEPWTEPYLARHRTHVARVLDDPDLLATFRSGAQLPDRYGIGLDERVVEYPWLSAQALGGTALDAGSTLNHAHILDRFQPRFTRLCIVTLAPEEAAFPERGVSYLYGDLRDMPFRDDYFDTVVSLSTLEHVGMDNRQYGSYLARAADPDAEVAAVLAELTRVLGPGGSLYVTIPYGRSEDHGWFRQFDRADVERLIGSAGAQRIATRVFAYSEAGWQVSDLDAAADRRYHDHLSIRRFDADYAAAARAVVCMRFSW